MSSPPTRDYVETPGLEGGRRVYVWLAVEDISGDCITFHGLYKEAAVRLRPGFLLERAITVGPRVEPVCRDRGLLVPIAEVRQPRNLSLAELSRSINQEVRAHSCRIEYEVKTSSEKQRFDCTRALEAEATAG